MLRPVSEARHDRRRYPRVGAPVFYRPAGLGFLHHRFNTRDISLGGMRVFSDEILAVNSRPERDVVLPDDSLVRCWPTVVWTEELQPEAGARFQLGLRFTDMAEPDLQRIRSLRRPS